MESLKKIRSPSNFCTKQLKVVTVNAHVLCEDITQEILRNAQYEVEKIDTNCDTVMYLCIRGERLQGKYNTQVKNDKLGPGI